MLESSSRKNRKEISLRQLRAVALLLAVLVVACSLFAFGCGGENSSPANQSSGQFGQSNQGVGYTVHDYGNGVLLVELSDTYTNWYGPFAEALSAYERKNPNWELKGLTMFTCATGYGSRTCQVLADYDPR